MREHCVSILNINTKSFGAASGRELKRLWFGSFRRFLKGGSSALKKIHTECVLNASKFTVDFLTGVMKSVR